jgi:predicted nucleotidyltransferase
MVSPAVHNVIAEHARRARHVFGGRILEIRLYGSFARGDANERSDVEVFVLLHDWCHDDWLQLVHTGAQVGLEAGLVLDLQPLVMSEGEFEELRRHDRRLISDIRSEGVPY